MTDPQDKKRMLIDRLFVLAGGNIATLQKNAHDAQVRAKSKKGST